MTHGVKVVKPEATLQEAAEKMRRLAIGPLRMGRTKPQMRLRPCISCLSMQGITREGGTKALTPKGSSYLLTAAG